MELLIKECLTNYAKSLAITGSVGRLNVAEHIPFGAGI